MLDFLRGIALFKDLEEDLLARLAGVAREETYPHNRILFREGDEVDAFYLVRSGSVTVFREVKGRPLQVLARLSEGGFFGEMGLLNRARRIASARTAGPTTLVRVAKQDLLDVLAQNPLLELRFRGEVIRRHGLNVSALLALAGQRDVRIRLGSEAELELPDGSRREVMLENLSLGGVGLTGAPPAWQVGQEVHFALALRGGPVVLEAAGTVTWREGDSIGIAFDPDRSFDPMLIHRAIRTFLDSGRK